MGKLLLVVDDSTTIRTAVELIFEGTEYRVVSKESGTSALAWMRTNTPDLILVDERMPDMDGYDFGSKVKANDENQELPILLLACQDGPDESRADETDLDGYVNKPFGSQELVTLVEMLTGSSQISQMPLSFKEQLVQRQREKKAQSGGAGAQGTDEIMVDEQLAFEAALASVSEEPKKPEAAVEISTVDTNPPSAEPFETEERVEVRSPSSDIEVEVEVEAQREREIEIEGPSAAVDSEDEQEIELDREPESEILTPPPEPAPPRFPPPPPAAPRPVDLAIPLPPSSSSSSPRREMSPPRNPPPPRPSLAASSSMSLPRPTPPPEPSPPPMRETIPESVAELMVSIEAPIEAAPTKDLSNRRPARAKPPEIEIEEPVLDPPPPPAAPPRAPPAEPPDLWKGSLKPSDDSELTRPPRTSSSRGLLFALLALAVIGGLVAFYFVS